MNFSFSLKNISAVILVVMFVFTAFSVVSTTVNSSNVAFAWGSGGTSSGGSGPGSGGDGCGGCGGGGGGGDDGGGDPNPDPDPVDPMACTLTANPNTIDKGDSSTLSWTTSNAYTASVSQGIGAVAVGSGQKSVSPNQTTTYTMTVQNIFGQTANCSAKVTVIQPAPAPTCDALYFDPNPVEKGDLTDLVWETSHASKVTLKNLTSGQSFVVKADGSWTDLDFYQDQTYNLTVEGADGSTDVCETTLTVNQPAPGPDPECTLSAQPSTIDKGDNLTLTWTTTNATKVSINQGIGSVSLDGSKTVSPNQTITYTLTAENSDGDKVNCSAKVTVVQSAPDPECTLNASLTTVTKGDSTELSWTTKNAWVVALNPGFGSVQKNGSVTVNPDSTTTYTLTVSQEGRNAKSVDCTVKIIVIDTPTTPDPECTLSARPSTLDKGDNSTLTWTTTNATKVSINQGIGSVSLDGSKTVSPNQTITYTLTAENSDGDKVNCSAKVTVIQPDPLPQCVIDASPNTIIKGDTSLITWSTIDAETASIDQGIGSVPTGSGQSLSVTPNKTTTYTMTVENKSGDTANCQTTITVKEATPIPECTLSVDPDTLPDGGGNVALSWTTKNADDVSINQGIGDVSDNGSRTVSITKSTIFTLTAENESGDVTCSAEVEVKDSTPDPITCEDNVHFSANPSNIKKGESTELKWTTSGITSVSINQGIGSVALDGSKMVSPGSDITYTLTASDGDDTISCPVSVDVDSGGGGGTLYPRCELDISDENISEGQSITLEWDSRYATDIEITDGLGNIIVTTHDRLADDKRDFFDGDKKLRPTRDTTYTMVAERGGREDDCEVSVEVEDDIVVIEDRDQKPLVSGIALTHVPYTGFEAGPMLTMLFYTLLTIWALFVAYVYIMRRGGKTLQSVSATGMYTPASMQQAVNPDLFPTHGRGASYTTAVANTATSLPRLCPDSSAPVGWNTTESTTTEENAITGVETNTEFAQLESQAHDKQVLISQDALVQFMDVYGNGQNEMFDTILDYARSVYTNESGWVVLNTARMHELLQTA